jgi:PEP-utilizing family enzyme
MATIVPVDEFISDEWYPGFKPDFGRAPWCVDPMHLFRKEDEQELWFVDFHWQRGLTPMGLTFNQDGYTSPNWTPAFAKIAACVCDGGGTLSHAAIVGREYSVPTVTATGLATVVIADGDEVEVDGTTGWVTVLQRAGRGH